jgi:NDP-sugar pyrophosphorylase family protein
VNALAHWPALVLAAGLGTRLRPLSVVRAKAAVPVAGRPLIVRVLNHLERAGVRRVVVNLHHLPDSITEVVGDGSQFGLAVRYSWERDLLGSAGGPARAIPLLAADRFFIVNGDTLTDVDLAALAASHRATGALVTMAVAPADQTRYNAVLADLAGAVVGFAPRTPHSAPVRLASSPDGHAARSGDAQHPAPVHPGPTTPFHFIGVQAVSAAAFAGVSPERPSETVSGLYPRLIAGQAGSLRVFTGASTAARSTQAQSTGRSASAGEAEAGERRGVRFFDIGTPADYVETVRRIAAEENRGLDRGEDSAIDPTASVDGSIIWDRVCIGPGASVTDCIVADDVTIPPGARYHRQVITRNATEPITP